MAVFNLHAALSGAPSASRLVGMVPLGRAPVGMALSPDGARLYATSESSPGSSPGSAGTLSVISVSKAESSPRAAVVATVPPPAGGRRRVPGGVSPRRHRGPRQPARPRRGAARRPRRREGGHRQPGQRGTPAGARGTGPPGRGRRPGWAGPSGPAGPDRRVTRGRVGPGRSTPGHIRLPRDRRRHHRDRDRHRSRRRGSASQSRCSEDRTGRRRP